jgi:microcystin-dependent protein
MRLRLVTAMIVLAVPLLVSAEEPGFITYSGRLTDGTAWGQSTQLDLTFRVYGSVDSDTLLWQQSQDQVPVEDGYFSVKLDDGENSVGEPHNVTVVFRSHEQTWITACLGENCMPADDMQPRQPVGSVPYAVRAETAATVGTITADAIMQQVAVPVGTILPYGGGTAPTGYALCDGEQYLRVDYPALFQAIGSAYGAESNLYFNVPDFRGLFLRGLDSGSGRDPDIGERQVLIPGGNSGPDIGSYQPAAFMNHSHDDNLNVASGGNHSHPLKNPGKVATSGCSGGGATPPAAASCGTHSYADTNSAGSHSHGLNGGVSQSTTGKSESRPKNVAVNFIIRMDYVLGD